MTKQTKNIHERKNIAPGTWIWVPHKKTVWELAQVIKCNDDNTILTKLLQNGDQQSFFEYIVPANTIIHLANTEDLELEKFSTIDDLTQLTHLNEATVLNALRYRYTKDTIYSYTGTVLIAINPFKEIPGLYSYNEMMHYMQSGHTVKKTKPHVFAVASEAYKNLCQKSTSQALLINGESGAGKTESTKYVMNYLATVGTQYSTKNAYSIEKKILESNPLLETFGNAKTLRNENSSRFGKFIEMQFELERLRRNDQTSIGKLVGAKIQTYLLETVRVCHQIEEERNYHSFYQLCAAVQTAKNSKEHPNIYKFPSILTDTEDIKLSPIEFDFTLYEDVDYFHYLTQSSCRSLKRADDLHEFENTIAAMQTIGLSHEEQVNIWTLIEAILFLGNITFEPKPENTEASRISEKSMYALNAVHKNIHIDINELEAALTTRTIRLTQDECKILLKTDDCENARDSLAKALYKCLFSKLVHQSNEAIGYSSRSAVFCGVLDIFGFECFENNSFEQLCINYTNERLQEYFNSFIFQLEEKRYFEEGIPWDPFEFPDNQDCVQLLDHHVNGIFAMVDEEGLFPQGTSQTFCNKIKAKFADHPKFFYHKHKLEDFIIKHFAGEVTYCANGFLEKNQDFLSVDVQNCILNSSSIFVSQLFKNYLKRGGVDLQNLDKQKQQRGNRLITISSEFIKQLDDLMKFITDTEPYFIRCIKPNQKNVSSNFSEPDVIEQLKYGGIIQVLHVSRAGYPIRMSHQVALTTFKCLADPSFVGTLKNIQNIEEKLKKLMQHLSEKYHLNKTQFGVATWAVGKTRLFIKFDTYEMLTNNVSTLKWDSAIRIQAAFRKQVDRKKFLAVKNATIRIQALFRGKMARKLAQQVRIENASVRIQTYIRQYQCRMAYLKLRRQTIYINHLIRIFCHKHDVQMALEEKAAIIIQAHYKRNIYRKQYVKQKLMIIRIQLWWKRVLAKRTLRVLQQRQRDAQLLQSEVIQLRQELKTMTEIHQETLKQLNRLKSEMKGMESQHTENLLKLQEEYEKMAHDQKEKIDLWTSKQELDMKNLNLNKKIGIIANCETKITNFAVNKTKLESKESIEGVIEQTPSPASGQEEKSPTEMLQKATRAQRNPAMHKLSQVSVKSDIKPTQKIKSSTKSVKKEKLDGVSKESSVKSATQKIVASDNSQNIETVSSSVSKSDVSNSTTLSSVRKKEKKSSLHDKNKHISEEKNSIPSCKTDHIEEEKKTGKRTKKRLQSFLESKPETLLSVSQNSSREFTIKDAETTAEATSKQTSQQTTSEKPIFKSAVFSEFNNDTTNKSLYSYHEHHMKKKLDLLILGYSLAINDFIDETKETNIYRISHCSENNSCPFAHQFELEVHNGDIGSAVIGYIENYTAPFVNDQNQQQLVKSMFSQCLNYWLHHCNKILIVYDLSDINTCNNAYHWMRLAYTIVCSKQNVQCFCYGPKTQPLPEKTAIGKFKDRALQKLHKNMTLVEAIEFICKRQKVSKEGLETLAAEGYRNSLRAIDHLNVPLTDAYQTACTQKSYKNYIESNFSEWTQEVNPFESSILYPSLGPSRNSKKNEAASTNTSNTTISVSTNDSQSDQELMVQTLTSNITLSTTIESGAAVTCLAFGHEFQDSNYYFLAAAHSNGLVKIYRVLRTPFEEKAYEDFIKSFYSNRNNLTFKSQNSLQHASSLEKNGKTPSANKSNKELKCSLEIEFQAHQDALITQLIFLPNNECYILTSALDNTIRLWNIRTGHMEKFYKDTSYCIALIFLPSRSSCFLTSNANATMRLVDSNRGGVLQRLQYPAPITVLAYDYKGIHCFAGSNLGMLYVLNSKEVENQYCLENKFETRVAEATITCITYFSTALKEDSSNEPDYDYLVISACDSYTYILKCQYSAPDQKLLTGFTQLHKIKIAHDTLPLKHCVSQANNITVISPDEDKNIQVFTSLLTKEKKVIQFQLSKQKAVANIAAINATHTVFATGDISGQILLWRSNLCLPIK